MARDVTVSLYHWDFNRVGPDFDPRFETCSIAIFQWQPKAGGKGLKKVNAARVSGYACDLPSLYAKAREVCDQLNADRVEVGKRPQWLQKEYSVPRPKSLPKSKPRVDRLLPGIVRSIRERVMKRLLMPAEFVRAKDATWVRRRGDQIQLIYFQGSKWGDEYFVNLAVHYAFLPPLFVRNKIPLAKYSFLDCGLQKRLIGTFEYGSDRGALELQLARNVTDCLREFTKSEENFAHPNLQFASENDRRKQRRGGWYIHNEQFFSDLIRHRRTTKPSE